MPEETQMLAAYLGLLVLHAGGEVVIPEEEIIGGLPEGKGVRVSVLEDNSVKFSIEDLPSE